MPTVKVIPKAHRSDFLQNRANIEVMLDRGIPPVRIAQQLGLGEASVYRHIRKLGYVIKGAPPDLPPSAAASA